MLVTARVQRASTSCSSRRAHEWNGVRRRREALYATLMSFWASRGARGAPLKPSKSEAERLVDFANTELDYQAKLEFLDAAVAAARDENESDRQVKARAYLLKGNAFAVFGEYQQAREAFTMCVDTAMRNATRGVDLPLAYDGLGIVLMQEEIHEYDEAVAVLEKAIAAAAASGLGGVDVPTYALVSGLRGGAPTMLQRLELHRALAQTAAGPIAKAVASFERIDKGPNPDGYPQFWEARAALTASLWKAGAKVRAEQEWKALCLPSPVPPPSTPTNTIYANVNRAAQFLLRVEGAFVDTACEDYSTGVFIPCDDAGIPGLGGSAAPCEIFTEEEVRLRLWPSTMIRALVNFRSQVDDE